MLRRFRGWFSFGVTANQGVVTGHRTPLGYQQILDATLAAATPLTIPQTTVASVPGGQKVNVAVGFAIIQNSGTVTIRWRDDGTAPTATVGMVLAAGAELDYVGDFEKIQFIRTAAGSQLEVSLYS